MWESADSKGYAVAGGFRDTHSLLGAGFLLPLDRASSPAAQVHRGGLACLLAARMASQLFPLNQFTVLIRAISPDFSLELTGFFPGKHLIQFLVLKMKDFWNFVLDKCILDFDAEQVYLKLQVTNLKNNEVTVNPKPKP